MDKKATVNLDIGSRCDMYNRRSHISINKLSMHRTIKYHVLFCTAGGHTVPAGNTVMPTLFIMLDKDGLLKWYTIYAVI